MGKIFLLAVFTAWILIFSASLPAREKTNKPVTVPIVLDHSRMLVEAEFQRKDGSWRRARLWVDTGNPSFYISKELARDLGIDFSADEVNPIVPPPSAVRIGGKILDFDGVRSRVILEPFWLFTAMHNDANLPSTVLQQYRVVFDYPKHRLILADPGALKPRGIRAPAAVNPETGIIQIDAVIEGENFSFALDNGASYSFLSREAMERISRRNPGLPRITGAAGCANMWGWWPPEEQALPLVRLPGILWGPVRLPGIGAVVVTEVSPGGPGLGAWYSQKTARPVDGFLGPNAFKAFRVEIDYAGQAVYFEKGRDFDSYDLDMVGLILRPEPDHSYRVIGIVKKEGKPAVGGVEPGDMLVRVGNLNTRGATMGAVVDALRGKPGEVRVLLIERKGKSIEVVTRVKRLL